MAPIKPSRWGAMEREAYIAALGRYGDAHKEKIVPILRTALATKGSMLAFKKNALKLMARFGSDDGVAYCLDVLRQGNDGDVSNACAYYLGERRTSSAASLLIRGLENPENADAFTRALGLVGSKEAIFGLKATYEKRVGGGGAIKEAVALLNLGDKSYDYASEIAAQIQGKRTLFMNEKQRKAEDLKKKRKGAAERWRQREAETDEQIARNAAIEATYVTNAAAASKIDAALRATAKKSDWPKASAYATSALAQRGDASAVAPLVKMLSSPRQDVRDIAVDAFGALYDQPEAFTNYVGRKGLVAASSAAPALAAYIDSEPKEERRVKALRALGVVRSFSN